MLLYHLPLLLLCASLIEATGGKGGGGGGDKGGGGGGCKGGGCGKGGGGGGKGGGGGGKGGGGGGKKGLHGNWVRHGPSLAGADLSAYYGELYQRPEQAERRNSHPPANRPVFVPSYPPAAYYPLTGNKLYQRLPGQVYGKGYGMEYGKSYYPVTQGWYGSYDKGWQGRGGPAGYYKGPDLFSEQDDRTALYVRKGLQGAQDYEGAYRLRTADDGGQSS